MTGTPVGPSYVLQPASHADLDAVVELAHRFYTEEGFATGRDRLTANLRQLIANSSVHVLLAVTDGAAVAFTVTTTTLGLEHLRVAELQDLYVLAEHRRGGLASRLIDTAADWARTQGCEVLDVVVDPHGDERHQLRAYYRARGFEDEGRRLLSRPLT